LVGLENLGATCYINTLLQVCCEHDSVSSTHMNEATTTFLIFSRLLIVALISQFCVCLCLSVVYIYCGKTVSYRKTVYILWIISISRYHDIDRQPRASTIS